MPICIECRYPVPQLYHVLHSTSSKPAATNPNGSLSSILNAASQKTPTKNNESLRNVNSGSRGGGEASKKSRSAGADVRLTQCPRCKRFADKYVEHDFVVLFIDLVLVKPQVYRHLLINRLAPPDIKDPRFDPAIIRLGILLTLFDVYLTWSRIESLPATQTASSPIPQWPIPAQYLFFLVLSVASSLAQHLMIRSLAKLPLFKASFEPQHSIPSTPATVPGTPAIHNSEYQNPTSPYMPPPQTPVAPASLASSLRAVATPSGISISTALVVSSCMKLFPILMVVWKYDDAGGQVASGVRWAVAVQNLEALRIVLGLAYWQAGLLVLFGRSAEAFVEGTLLELGGLGDVGVNWGLRLGVSSLISRLGLR